MIFPRSCTSRIARASSIPGGTPDELITLGEMKMRYVRKVLSLSNGNKSLAARILGIDRRTISHRVVESTQDVHDE